MSALEIEGELGKIFSQLKQRSVKWSSYLPIYDGLLQRFKDKEDLVLVEIGVLNGGSLFMWKSFFRDSARIIGIDSNPTAERMREHGFEIFIGDQASPGFWQNFFKQVGPVDVIIDDGGHTNKHQIMTIECCLDNVRDGGIVVVEDVCTSYMKRFGNPSKYSFINYSKSIIDSIQTRSPYVSQEVEDRFTSIVYSIAFFQSIVCFNVDRRLCNSGRLIEVGEEHLGALDYRNVDKRLVGFTLEKQVREMIESTALEKFVRGAYSWCNALAIRVQFFLENRRLRQFFKKTYRSL